MAGADLLPTQPNLDQHFIGVLADFGRRSTGRGWLFVELVGRRDKLKWSAVMPDDLGQVAVGGNLLAAADLIESCRR